MFEPRNAAEARIACRIYVDLFEADEAGSPVAIQIAAGPPGPDVPDWHLTMSVMDRMQAEKQFDSVATRNGAPFYTLQPDMRQHMASEVRADFTRADRVRELLEEFDRGDDVPDEAFLQLEEWCRKGR